MACANTRQWLPGVATVLGGLEEDLYRDALSRRIRHQQREQQAWAQQVEDAKPRINRTSRALCQEKLGREIQDAFTFTGGVPALQDDGEVLVVPRSHIALVLESLGLLNGADDEEGFCTKLGLLLDKERTGFVSDQRLQAFLLRSLDREKTGVRLSAGSSEEECFNHLEQRLSRSLGRLVSNRLSKPTAELASRLGRRAATPPPSRGGSAAAGVARSASPRRTPRSEAQRAHDENVASSRCNLLYQQAVFASKETAQLEEGIKLLKQREEMRECTFHPKLLPPSRPASPRNQPRNFDTTIARMRAATRRREEYQEELQHVPCGENYERLRRLGPQPFACYFKEKSLHRRPPLVYVDVNVGKGRTGRIGVHEGDNVRELARNFGKAFQLDKEMQHKLEGLLKEAYEDQLRVRASAEEDFEEEPTADFGEGRLGLRTQ